MFTQKDLAQFNQKGITVETIEKQLENFRKGFPPVILEVPAIPGNGIIVPTPEEIDKYISTYESVRSTLEIVKFVPASGAATRMFKDLFAFLEKSETGQAISSLLQGSEFLLEFFQGIRRFAFTRDMEKILKGRGTSVDLQLQSGNITDLVKCLLEKSGLGYGNLPKGLLKFHDYGNYSRTAFEEHLVEGALYAGSAGQKVRIHLTVSPEFMMDFIHHYEKKRSMYEDIFNVRFEVDFSVQKPSTDTIAVDLNNHPFRKENGDIHFRPGGHGALLENLNEIDSDIIFIKNIDNVAPDRVKKNTDRYKKLLAGILLDYQSGIYRYVRILEEGNPGRDMLREICNFLGQDSCRFNKKNMEDLPDDTIRKILLTRLDRPVRVCGMVKNEGEPGGGPFWVIDQQNNSSLQIVETSQIDLTDRHQKDILGQSTHFNPVDLVCGVRNRKGKKYNLSAFIDPSTGFIAGKSSGGQVVKAQELPGLWNGAMAHWNTLFVEVPAETFTPVKTINDLLRSEHLT